MKSKLLVLFTALLFSGLFSACAEEEINPNDALNGHVAADGVTKDDTNF
jgi:hypothetical protein